MDDCAPHDVSLANRKKLSGLPRSALSEAVTVQILARTNLDGPERNGSGSIRTPCPETRALHERSRLDRKNKCYVVGRRKGAMQARNGDSMRAHDAVQWSAFLGTEILDQLGFQRPQIGVDPAFL